MDSFPAPAFSKKTFGETRADTVESVFLHRPGGSGVSDPRLQKIRIRNNCAGGKAATVAGYVGPGFHNWPPGHIDQTPDRKRHRPICPNGATHTSPGHRPGNRIRKSRCVLKEHRIGRAGSMSEAPKLCGVPSEREECCRVDSQGLHPGLVCDAPTGHGVRNRVRAWDWERVDVEAEWHRSALKNRSEKRSARRAPTRSYPFFLHRPGGSGFSDPSYKKYLHPKPPTSGDAATAHRRRVRMPLARQK